MLGIIAGIIAAIVGFLMVWRPDKFVSLIGEQPWMEKYLGSGHSTDGYRLIGLIIIIVGFLLMTGLVQGILFWFFAPVLRSGLK